MNKEFASMFCFLRRYGYVLFGNVIFYCPSFLAIFKLDLAHFYAKFFSLLFVKSVSVAWSVIIYDRETHRSFKKPAN